MKVFVTGATGHIGSYLVPRLLRNGHQVIACARNPQPKYSEASLGWDKVEWMICDLRAEQQAGTLLNKLKAIDCDAVIDLMSFSVEQNQILIDAFIGRIRHFIHCGSIWAYGPANYVPHCEHYPRNPQTDYGKNKTLMENNLKRLFLECQFPATVIHPGHISGKRWLPIDPQGSINGMDVYRKLATGQPVQLPRDGMPALHHVHGDDVAQVFELALQHGSTAWGETFSAAAPYGMTLKACCCAVASIFGRDANLEFVSMEEFEQALGEKAYRISLSHLKESVVVSVDKARRILGYQPRYTTPEIYAEFLEYQKSVGNFELL